MTIFRHGTSATVVEGAQGRIPPTMWFMTYSGIERLYYNLATQFKYWGALKHRTETWMFMSRLRHEYEENFINLFNDVVEENKNLLDHLQTEDEQED